MYILGGNMGRKRKESLLLPRLTDCNKPTFSIMNWQGFCGGWGRSQSQNEPFWEKRERLKSGIASRKKPRESQSKPVISLINCSCLKHKPDVYVIHKEKCGLGLLYFFFYPHQQYLQSLSSNSTKCTWMKNNLQFAPATLNRVCSAHTMVGNASSTTAKRGLKNNVSHKRVKL